MVDEDHERAELPRDAADHLAQVARLLVREAGGGLVEEDDPRLPHDGPRDLDEPPLTLAQTADLRGRRHIEADELDRGHDGGAPRATALAGVLVDHRDVVEDRELLDRLLGLERPPEAPARASEVDHLEEVLPERLDRAGGRLHEPREHVEERRLPRTVRTDEAARAAGKGHAHVVDRRDAGEANGEVLDLDHEEPSVEELALRKGRARSLPSFARSFGTWSASPPGAVSSTWMRPAPKMMSRKFGLTPH